MAKNILNLILPVVALQLVREINSWNKFCSVVCATQSCSSTTYAACSGQCGSPWSWNGTSNACELFATSGWSLVDVSGDIGGGITYNVTSTATCGPLGGGSQWQYSYIGNLTGTSSVIRFSDPNGVQVPHYQLRIIFWTILIDSWQGSDTFTVTLEGNQTQTTTRNSRATS